MGVHQKCQKNHLPPGPTPLQPASQRAKLAIKDGINRRKATGNSTYSCHVELLVGMDSSPPCRRLYRDVGSSPVMVAGEAQHFGALTEAEWQTIGVHQDVNVPGRNYHATVVHLFRDANLTTCEKIVLICQAFSRFA